MKFKMKAVLCGVMAAAMMAVAGCGGGGDAQKQAGSVAAAPQGKLMQQIKQKGVLVVGTASGYPPYEFVDTSQGDKKVIGVDMEFAQKVADKLGVKLQVQDMNFQALLTSLMSGKVDLAIAGINPTDERRKTMDFSNNYLPTAQKIMIRKEDAGKLKTIDDFKGLTLGVQKSTTQETVAKAEIPDAKIVALNHVPDVVLEVKNHKVDGLVVEGIVGQQYLDFNDDLTFSDAVFKNGTKNSAVALQKGNEDLLKVINEVIKENTDNGNYEKWVKEYGAKAMANAK